MFIKLLKIPLFVIMFIAIMCNYSLANQDLIVSISPNLNKAFEGQKITFTASAEGSGLSYEWSEQEGVGGTSESKEYTMPSISESPYVISCTVTDENNVSGCKEITIKIAKVKLESVSFSNNHTIRSDDSSMYYTIPHYRDVADDSEDRNYPICFTRNTKMSASVKWNIDIGSITPEPAIIIEGTGPGDLKFLKTLASFSEDGNYLISGVMECPNSFPDEIDIMEPMTIKWRLTLDGGFNWFDTYSHNNTYVTLGNTWDPTMNPLYHTSVHIGCENAEGKSSPNDLITGVWSAFSGGHVKRVDNTALEYYGSPARPYDLNLTARTLESLLLLGSGRCSAFQALFINILRVQGCDNLVASALNIREDVSYVNQATTAYQQKYGNPPSVDGYNEIEDIFFVEDWDLDSSDKWDAIDQSGIAGQGNINPLAVFSTHALVQIGTQIYDPSYGTGPFTSILDWENNSVDGYGVLFYKSPSELSADFLFWIGHIDIEDTQEVEEYNN